MPHFSSLPSIVLSVEVEGRAALCQYLVPFWCVVVFDPHIAEEVQHNNGAVEATASDRQTSDGSKLLLELGCVTSIDGVVT